MIKNKLFIAPIVLILIIFISSFIVGSCKITEGAGRESKVTEDTPAKEETKEEISIAEDETIAEVTSISVEEVYEIIKNNQDYIILDVRTKEEFNEGHLEDAILIPVSELESRLDELPKDKSIITYCGSGGRSGNAANILVENGFRKVYDMGGILDWQEEGYPVICEEEKEEVLLEIIPISVDESYEIFANEDYLFLDVRSLEEYESSHIEGAIHMPVSELEGRLDELPKDKTIIVYCDGVGCSRSGIAAHILIDNGFKEVYDMTGKGIIEWEEKGYPVEVGG